MTGVEGAALLHRRHHIAHNEHWIENMLEATFTVAGILHPEKLWSWVQGKGIICTVPAETAISQCILTPVLQAVALHSSDPSCSHA